MLFPRNGQHAGNQWDAVADVVLNVVVRILDSLLMLLSFAMFFIRILVADDAIVLAPASFPSVSEGHFGSPSFRYVWHTLAPDRDIRRCCRCGVWRNRCCRRTPTICTACRWCLGWWWWSFSLVFSRRWRRPEIRRFHWCLICSNDVAVRFFQVVRTPVDRAGFVELDLILPCSPCRW